MREEHLIKKIIDEARNKGIYLEYTKKENKTTSEPNTVTTTIFYNKKPKQE